MQRARRQFLCQLASGVVVAPFLPLLQPRTARAADAAGSVRRLVVVASLGTNKTLWAPTQAPGAALQLPAALMPLQAVVGQLVLVDGLSFPNPTEGHSTPQTLTGYTFSNGYGPTCTSVDQYIAAKVGGGQRLSSLLLGWQAKNEAQFWSHGQRLTTLDNPSDAWQSAFGVSAAKSSLRAAKEVGEGRQAVWNMVQKQAEAMASKLTGDNKDRLLTHAQSVAALLSRARAPAFGAGCAVPAQPDLGGADASNDTSQTGVATAHAALITAALACDVTRVVGMQFGTSNRQYMGGSVAEDEHSALHSGDSFLPKVIGAEQATSSWVAALAQSLAAVPDPLVPGTTLLDNTLIVWTRDIGHGPAHTQYSMPYALLGAGSYLAKAAGGRLLRLGGDELTATVGTPHQRLLLNLIDYMGAGAGQDFGTVAALAAPARSPLSELKG